MLRFGKMRGMKSNPFSTAAWATLGVASIIILLLIRFVMSFTTPLIILSAGRWLYCIIAGKEFSFWWPIHGAFFISMICTLGQLLSISQSRVELIDGELKKIPAKMVSICVVVFAIQFIWHGGSCFFSGREFLIADPLWIGDILVGAICAICCGIWNLIKYPFKRKNQ